MPKTEFKLKKTKKQRKFIKDKAIVNFLLEHMKPVKIDFSKIKIPSFNSFLEKEEKEAISQMNRMNKKFSKIIHNRNIFIKYTIIIYLLYFDKIGLYFINKVKIIL